ncbi:uncharacterized protein LOC132623784 isoform X2 [Lycium barbarum]|uniref:uncharacterized protein LOC132623784 isoform X2 n=1 Tax=Lycium barbarum TaxID=112863 RepID=UPI00293E80AC|nr:uncharacterized protein LOC132623784 isoform X2 [Lycium barbarum]
MLCFLWSWLVWRFDTHLNLSFLNTWLREVSIRRVRCSLLILLLIQILLVAQTMENIVPNINPEKSTYAPNHTGANISSVMAPDGNTGSLLGQRPSAPAVTASAPGINLGGPTLTEPNIHAPANALPASPELGGLHLLIPKLMGESDAVTK